jgi:hypothetical protein
MRTTDRFGSNRAGRLGLKTKKTDRIAVGEGFWLF